MDCPLNNLLYSSEDLELVVVDAPQLNERARRQKGLVAVVDARLFSFPAPGGVTPLLGAQPTGGPTRGLE